MSAQHRMKPWVWIAVASASVLTVVAVAAPAQWVASAVAQASGGRLQIADAHGTVWSGSGVVVVADGAGTEASRVALPERLAWSVAVLPLATGTLALTLSHPSALAQPMTVRVPLATRGASLSATTLRLPAALLTGLGAPFNSVRPGGVLQLSWDQLVLDPRGVHGALQAEWQQASSRLTPVAPMGHYRLSADGFTPGARLQLQTLSGPLELMGDGTIDDGGRLHFKGRAQPVAGTDPAIRTQLAGLISLLGQRSGDGAQLTIGS
ncbi:MAG: type II secretion system protein N [Burkholderiaceae bacterium]